MREDFSLTKNGWTRVWVTLVNFYKVVPQEDFRFPANAFATFETEYVHTATKCQYLSFYFKLLSKIICSNMVFQASVLVH